MAELDQVTAAAVDEARQAACSAAADFGVGDYLGAEAEGVRVVTHYFDCPHPGYPGWRWAVTMVRASRARRATINEVTLLPGEDALRSPQWVPWADRLLPGDVAPGTMLPTADNDPRLEPGYTGGELSADEDPAEWALTRAIAADLGLGRQRVLSSDGRAAAAERWLGGEGGPDNAMSHQAPSSCLTCGYWVRLSGQLGRIFGVCANEYSPSDARVTACSHGCGGHSDVVASQRPSRLPAPVLDTIHVDENLFV